MSFEYAFACVVVPGKPSGGALFPLSVCVFLAEAPL